MKADLLHECCKKGHDWPSLRTLWGRSVSATDTCGYCGSVRTIKDGKITYSYPALIDGSILP